MKCYTQISKENLDGTPGFTMGVSIFSKGSLSSIIGSIEEKSCEIACIVSSGKMRLKSKGQSQEEILESNDVLHVPPFAEYEIENGGDGYLKCAWAMSIPFAKISKNSNKLQNARVIRTLKEVNPIVLKVKGMEREIYRIPGVENFHFALFLRGPNTHSPLHTHVPENFEEGFVVLEGALRVSGINGESFTLRELDCAYVPKYGGNMNENKSARPVRYLWAGYPPVNVKEIPLERKLSKYEKALAVDKS